MGLLSVLRDKEQYSLFTTYYSALIIFAIHNRNVCFTNIKMQQQLIGHTCRRLSMSVTLVKFIVNSVEVKFA